MYVPVESSPYHQTDEPLYAAGRHPEPGSDTRAGFRDGMTQVFWRLVLRCQKPEEFHVPGPFSILSKNAVAAKDDPERPNRIRADNAQRPAELYLYDMLIYEKFYY